MKSETTHPTLVDLYRHLRRGSDPGGRVSKWLEHEEDAGEQLLHLEGILGASPMASHSPLTEQQLLDALEQPLSDTGPDTRARIAAALGSTEGREFLEGLAAWAESSDRGFDMAEAHAVAREGRAEYEKRFGGARPTVCLYRVVLDSLTETGAWLLRVLEVPAPQLALAATLRAGSPAQGSCLSVLPFDFEDGIGFQVSFSEGDGPDQLAVRIICHLHHEIQLIESAAINGKPIPLELGEAVAQMPVAVGKLEFSVTPAGREPRNFGCVIESR